MSVCSDSSINVAEQALQRNKTVECQLELTLEKLAATESNIELFNTLISLGLATNDVKNFVTKQCIHKRIDLGPDLKVQKVSMKSKLKDACAFAKRLRQLRDVLKGRLARKYSDRKACGRRILDRLLEKYRVSKSKQCKENRKKIDHLKQKSVSEKVIKSVPENTKEFLSDVIIFGPNQTDLGPEPPHLPFVCDEKIVLDENEIKLLAKGPKYMVREEVDQAA